VVAVKASPYTGDTKKRELLKCVVAAMYSWQHCGTGTLSYRHLRHFSNHGSDLIRQVTMVQFLSIIFFFVGFLQLLLGFSKVSFFLCHPFIKFPSCVGLMMGTRCHRSLPLLLLAPFFDNQFLSSEINLSNVESFSSAVNLLLSIPKVATSCVGECTSHQREDLVLFYFIFLLLVFSLGICRN